jgi:hypothetical protein
MNGNIVCVATQCFWQIVGAIKFGAFNGIQTFWSQSFSLLLLRKHRFSHRFLIDICSYCVDQVLMNGRRNAKTRDASVYPSFLQILIPPSIFLTLFYPVQESYILLNYLFSSIFQLQVHIEVYGLSWLPWLRWLNYLFLSSVRTLEFYRYKF